ncbi:MAG: hypothetical protein AB7O29_13615, partial [Acidimicrobiia bacterium]
VSGGGISCPGSCDDNDTATASAGTWTGTPAPTFTYAWYTHNSTSAASSCNPSMGGWSSQGSGPTLNLPNISGGSDAVMVRVTATNSDPGSPVTRNFCTTYSD